MSTRLRSNSGLRSLVLALLVVAFTTYWFATASPVRERDGEGATPPAPAAAAAGHLTWATTHKEERPEADVDGSPAFAASRQSDRTSHFRGGQREAIQRTSGLRDAVLRYTRSNEASYVVASLQARFYCSDMEGAGTSAAEHAAQRLYMPPPWRQTMNLSDEHKRIEVVELGRARCKRPDDAPANYDELVVQAARDAPSAYREIRNELRSLRSMDLRDLSDGTRHALYASDPALLITVAEYLSLRLPDVMPSALNEHEEALAATLAGHIAACRIGDLCTPDSFRMHDICLHWGACDGGNVTEAIGRLLGQRPEMRAQVRRYADAVLTAVHAGRP